MSGASGFKSAARLHESLLAAGEKRLLVWLAQRMPRPVNADHLTVLGFAAMGGAGLSYVLADADPRFLHVATVCLFINWFGDSLDGTLARIRNQQRPRYGYYVDHVVDTVGTLMLIGGMGLSRYMDVYLAMGLLIAYYMVAIEVYLSTHVHGVFRLSFGWWGPTELRILLAIGNVAMFFKPVVTIRGRMFLLADVGAAVAIACLLIVFAAASIRHTVQLYKEERL